jgi:hypothetical protein
VKLEAELLLFGSPTDAVEFEEVLQELHAVLHPSWTSEQLLYHPREALRFCEAIRARCGQGLPDEMVLRRLTNIRKRAEVPA